MLIRKLRDLREDNDYTQEYVADYLNVSQRAYSHYENGTRNISVELLMKLADLYNVSLDFILERKRKEN